MFRDVLLDVVLMDSLSTVMVGNKRYLGFVTPAPILTGRQLSRFTKTFPRLPNRSDLTEDKDDIVVNLDV